MANDFSSITYLYYNLSCFKKLNWILWHEVSLPKFSDSCGTTKSSCLFNTVHERGTSFSLLGENSHCRVFSYQSWILKDVKVLSSKVKYSFTRIHVLSMWCGQMLSGKSNVKFESVPSVCWSGETQYNNNYKAWK